MANCMIAGLIWDLDPARFPIEFCLPQMTIVALTSSVMMGTCTAWYYSALSAAVWPSKNGRYVVTRLVNHEGALITKYAILLLAH